jgi:molybdopterin molybdotransferase
VLLEHLAGRVLFDPIRAECELPRFDSSGVDGFGVRAEDVVPDQPLALIGEVAAGQDPGKLELGPGEAIRIFTGSGIPSGVDAVVMQEDVRRVDDEVWMDEPVEPGRNIRRQGAEIMSGTEVLPVGVLASPPVLSMLATLGVSTASVYKRPRFALVGTGSELVPVGSSLGPGQVYESILPGIAAAISGCGGIVVSTAVVHDDPIATQAALAEALDADVVVACGGMSVGDYDLVKGTLARLGVEERIWPVAIKPGKPFFFGMDHHGKRVFGLPGNPVAALVTFYLLIRPALLKMTGREPAPFVRLPLAGEWPACGDRDEFIRARIVDGAVLPHPAQGSHMLTGLAMADALIRFPAFSGPYRDGDFVEAIRIDW